MRRDVEVKAPHGTAWIRISEGTVIHQDTQRWSSTHVSASGGGGYVGRYGGHLSAPTVHSQVTHHAKTTFWIEEPDGKQQSVVICNENFLVAPGHKVRFVGAGNKKNLSKGSIIYVRNLVSGRDAVIYPYGLWEWALDYGLIKIPLLRSIIVVWLPICFWSYLVFFVIPLFDKELAPPAAKEILLHYPEFTSLHDFLVINFKLVPHWSFSLLLKCLARWEYWVAMALGAFGWAVTTGILMLVVYLVFFWWWKKIVFYPLGKRLNEAFNLPLQSPELDSTDASPGAPALSAHSSD